MASEGRVVVGTVLVFLRFAELSVHLLCALTVLERGLRAARPGPEQVMQADYCGLCTAVAPIVAA